MTRNARESTLRTCAPSVDSDQPESSLGTFWIAKYIQFLHADNEESDQTALNSS